MTPRSANNGVDGIAQTADGAALKVRVRAVAEDGKANRAAELAVAEWLGVARRCVAVSAGTKSRNKTLDIAGEPAELAGLMEKQLSKLP